MLPGTASGRAKVAFLAESSAAENERLTIRSPDGSKTNIVTVLSVFSHVSASAVALRVAGSPSVNDTVAIAPFEVA